MYVRVLSISSSVVGRRSLSVWYGGGAAAQKRANLTPFNALHILAARTAVVPVTYTQPTHTFAIAWHSMGSTMSDCGTASHLTHLHPAANAGEI